jgi:hypothetical protein
MNMGSMGLISHSNMPPSMQKSRSAPYNQAKPLLCLAAPNEDNAFDWQKDATKMNTKFKTSDVFNNSGNQTTTGSTAQAIEQQSYSTDRFTMLITRRKLLSRLGMAFDQSHLPKTFGTFEHI